MAMSELKVTPSKLKSKAGEFKSKANKVHRTTDKMLNEIKTINGSTWAGDASDAYKKQFAKLENDMNDMFKMITEYSSDLEDIAAQYESTEKANEALAHELETDVIK
ncbi:MAG: WXG100 family type VII secretion target [Lachnospiraceae bacterium]|nr:WXG100 family type VII secretion target [Lachnospiraceae bacterium]